MIRLLTDIREMLRSLSNKHNKVKSFKTIEQHQMNDNYHEYPMVVLFTDTDLFTVNAYTPDTEVSTEYVTVQFQIGVYTNQFEGYNVNEFQFEPVLNEIRRVTPNPEHTMVDDCSAILMDFINKINYDFEEDGFRQLIDYNWTIEQDVATDKVSGVIATLTVKWPVYSCDFEDSFGDDNLSELTDYKDV